MSSADNGGTAGGNNYPLRGFKRTNWEGGMRVAAFVSGGLIPTALRGTSNDQRFHIVDWYPTFCHLAGIGAISLSLCIKDRFSPAARGSSAPRRPRAC